MAQIDHKLELLKQVPLFKDLSRHDIEQVGQLTEEVDVPAGQVLTREGAPGSEFFVIVDGPRTATATTTTPSKLLVLGRREFRSLMDSYPSIEHSVLHCLVDRLRNVDHSFSH